ncbi:MAG: pitrilysin family protein, partial [Bdellovibrionota bacterium]
MAKIFEPEVLELSNGVPVVLQHYEGPVASTYWWVKTGSADEEGPEAGFAHFLEHMHFKDAAAKETGKSSTGKMAQAVESLGGDINAYTSFDQTVYHVTCAAHHWERVIDVFGGMAKPQRFLKSDFDREREVIIEELKKNEDSPGRQLFQTLFAATFKKHPYGRPVIGFEKLLKGAKLSSLEAFYKRNYVSSKMGVILVGPVGNGDSPRRARILKSIEKYFGSKVIKSTKAEKEKVIRRYSEPALRNQPDFVVRPFDVKMPSVSFSFRVPELMHPDIPALDVLSGVLGMGELSRLYQRLFYQKSLVSEISAGLYVPKDPGMFYVQAEPGKKENI